MDLLAFLAGLALIQAHARLPLFNPLPLLDLFFGLDTALLLRCQRLFQSLSLSPLLLKLGPGVFDFFAEALDLCLAVFLFLGEFGGDVGFEGAEFVLEDGC